MAKRNAELTPAKRKAIAQEARIELAKRCYTDYVQLVHAGRWKRARHLDLVCRELENIMTGKTKRLMIFMPPRHGKSMTVTESFPSYYLGRNPEKRVIEISYSGELATQFGKKNRDKVAEFGPMLFGHTLSNVQATKTNWNMLITFTVKDQKITHDLKTSLVAGSSGIVQAAFAFDESWSALDKVVVFKSSACRKPATPQRISDEPIDIPPEALKPGKLYVSIIGYGTGSTRKTTRAWDVMQAITVQKCGTLGDSEILRSLAQGNLVSDDNVATDDEVNDMFDDVFGSTDTPVPGPGSGDTPTVDDEDVATDDEVNEMFDEVFGREGAL